MSSHCDLAKEDKNQVGFAARDLEGRGTLSPTPISSSAYTLGDLNDSLAELCHLTSFSQFSLLSFSAITGEFGKE